MKKVGLALLVAGWMFHGCKVEDSFDRIFMLSFLFFVRLREF